MEADRLTRATVSTFYDAKSGGWVPIVASAESVGRQGYTFWPSLLAWQAVIEAAKVNPKVWRPRVGSYYRALSPYFDQSVHAYCAWHYFPGNDDHFYDDNAWAAVACMEAYDVTRDASYRARATEVFEGFVKGGWDARGGLRWGTKAGILDRKDRTVSATAAGALAGLLIGGKENRAWAKRALDWVRGLSDGAGLIQDGVKSDGSVLPTRWTYNTGVPIRAAVEYARQSGDRASLSWAVRMGDAAIDRSRAPLFDASVELPPRRMWWDGLYFSHYLVDGLCALGRATGDGRYVAECRREAAYARTLLRDRDGLYWRNLRLWRIDAERAAAFGRWTGQGSPALDPDASERSMEPSAMGLPAADRPMVKTLLANAGAARMFWLLAR